MKRFTALIENVSENEHILIAVEDLLLEDERILSMESRFYGTGERACAELKFEFDGDPLLICMELRLRYDVVVKMY